MKKSPIRVLCVDDHAFLVDGLKSRFALERDIEFVGWLNSAEGLVTRVREVRPHVVLLDIEMPGPDPFEVLEDLQNQTPEVRVIMFSAYIRDHYIDAAVSGGAWGYLSKSDAPDVVVKAIRKVEQGDFAFSPRVVERFQHHESTRKKPAEPKSKLDLLTPRELQVLRMIGRGMSRQEIAEITHRSPKTIDNHQTSIMEKLGIHDRVELALYAVREGLAEA